MQDFGGVLIELLVCGSYKAVKRIVDAHKCEMDFLAVAKNKALSHSLHTTMLKQNMSSNRLKEGQLEEIMTMKRFAKRLMFLRRKSDFLL